MTPLDFKRHRFPPTIIRHCVWLYARFTLSLRDVEEMLAERGVDVSYETVRRWFLKFGPGIAANLRRTRPKPSDYWHLDEMAVTISRSVRPGPSASASTASAIGCGVPSTMRVRCSTSWSSLGATPRWPRSS